MPQRVRDELGRQPGCRGSARKVLLVGAAGDQRVPPASVQVAIFAGAVIGKVLADHGGDIARQRMSR